MATRLAEMYGLTTDDAMLAFRRHRLDLLSNGNRWKPFLLDHVAGVHTGRPDRFRHICLACRNRALETTEASAP